jgi:hypothetical protein
MILNYRLGRMCKELVVVYFIKLSQCLCAEEENIHRFSLSPGRDAESGSCDYHKIMQLTRSRHQVLLGTAWKRYLKLHRVPTSARVSQLCHR